MNRWILILTLAALPLCSAAQSPSYFANGGRGHRHFVGLSYAFGTTHWRSATSGYKFFDHQGMVLSNGTAKLKAKNAYQALQLEVLVPFQEGAFYLGMGIAFEEYALTKIEVSDEFGSTERPFVETFRFDKFFFQGEVPLLPIESERWEFAVNGRVGYYAFTGVNSLSLFGERRLGKAWFSGLGFRTQFKVHDVVYLVVMPTTEYKYFRNSDTDVRGRINHNLFDFGLLTGFRVHLL